MPGNQAPRRHRCAEARSLPQLVGQAVATAALYTPRVRKLLAALIVLPAVVSSQQPVGEIRGAVVNAVPDMAHAGRVELRSGQTRRLAQTGTTGAFDFYQLPPGIYDLEISENFFRAMTIRAVSIQSGEVRTLPPVTLRFEGAIIDCNRRSPDFLHPLDRFEAGKGALAGRIIDDHGHPLADAKVRLYISNAGIIGSAITDDTGRFSIPDVPARSRYEIEVVRDGFFTEDFSDFEVQPGYESFYDRIDLAPCEKDRCQPALRPIRPLNPCV